ncbi:hypothetical protein TNCV_4128681 [Trichonephila clavipes]|nr:hypothetical protein TNCV_4128681 [Trichonephila clavipes]
MYSTFAAGGYSNSCRPANPLVMLVEGEEKWEVPDPSPGCSPSKLRWNQAKNCTVTCMVPKATANDSRTSSPLL